MNIKVHRLRLVLFFVASLSSTIILRGNVSAQEHGAGGSFINKTSVNVGEGLPLRLPPLAHPLFDLSRDDYNWIRRQIQPCDASNLSPSYCLHVLRAHGMDGKLESTKFPTGRSLLTPILETKSAKQVFGEAALVPVLTGARYQTRVPVNQPRWRENHRDQNLSAFAELGLSQNTALMIDDRAVSIGDVLHDSLSNFYPKQEEIEWSALAYALYLPPRREWKNRYGERYSFDDLVEELLRRPMVGSSCGGTHLLFSLTMIARADDVVPILTSKTRQHIRDRLFKCVHLAVRSQQTDGSWPGDWFFESELLADYRGPTPVSTPEHRLTVTGHLAEWMLYLPSDIQAPDQTLRQACRWLLSHLKELDSKDIESQICPCTHGICVLRRLSRISNSDRTLANSGL